GRRRPGPSFPSTPASGILPSPPGFHPDPTGPPRASSSPRLYSVLEYTGAGTGGVPRLLEGATASKTTEATKQDAPKAKYAQVMVPDASRIRPTREGLR